MIKHIVLWTFHETADGRGKEENIKIAVQLLESLKSKIQSVKYLETGTNIASGSDAFDLSLYCEFEDKRGLKEYQDHPEHLKVIDFLRKVRDKRVFTDYEI
jgi:hypothetical protein